MTTSIENILSDIFSFLKKAIRTFLGVFSDSYRELIDNKLIGTSEILSPNLYIVLAITIFHSITIGTVNNSYVGSAGFAFTHFMELKNYSLIERFLYSTPIWLSFFILVKIFSLLCKKENRRTYSYYTAYVIGTLLLVFLLVRFLLFVTYYLGHEANTPEHFVRPLFSVVKTLDVLFSIFTLIFCSYKLIFKFRKQKNNHFESIFMSVSIGLIFLIIIKITKLERKVLERYFPQNSIQIASNLNNHNELKFRLINDNQGLYTLRTSIYITNASEENLILEHKNQSLFLFSSISKSEDSLADLLSSLHFNYIREGNNDTPTLILKSGDTKYLVFEAPIDSSKGNWLLSQFDRGIEHDFYVDMILKSTNRFFTPPYFRRKIIIEK